MRREEKEGEGEWKKSVRCEKISWGLLMAEGVGEGWEGGEEREERVCVNEKKKKKGKRRKGNPCQRLNEPAKGVNVQGGSLTPKPHWRIQSKVSGPCRSAISRPETGKAGSSGHSAGDPTRQRDAASTPRIKPR